MSVFLSKPFRAAVPPTLGRRPGRAGLGCGGGLKHQAWQDSWHLVSENMRGFPKSEAAEAVQGAPGPGHSFCVASGSLDLEQQVKARALLECSSPGGSSWGGILGMKRREMSFIII